MKHRTMIEIEGIKISPRFLKFIDSKWVRECERCKSILPPTSAYFYVKGTKRARTIERICKTCRNKNNVVDRTCSRCGKIKPTTTENFKFVRGTPMRTCRECSRPNWRARIALWRQKNPRSDWESKIKSAAKGRATKRGIPYDETAVSEIISAYINGSSCPCCHRIMAGEYRWPSLDRIDSSRGYERDNMGIICTRCNWVKNNGTLAELKGIVTYMENG